MRATMESVALAAGVSIMTVSRVVRGDPHVAHRTRERVIEVLKNQGYGRTPFHAAWQVSIHGDRVASKPSIA